MLLLDVLQAQNELDTARLRYADAVVRYNQSQVNLLASLGLLDAPALSPATQPSRAVPVP
jgi:outer membrane protein TolC